VDKTYDPKKSEGEVYQKWETSGAFTPNPKGVPYTILMPPPNANASLHAGHGMYTIDDILIRWKRMLGFATDWIPGMDHAGFETQFVYEKNLQKKGQSRMDFDRTTLYNNIFQFVKDNSGLIYEQFKRLGFSANWKKSVFMLDDNVIETVYNTFQKMESEGLIYRDDYIVNYCTHCGTSLAELEVKHLERVDPLYYIKYGPLTLATVRPETKFGDTAVAVNPKDKRYQQWIGQEIKVVGLIGDFKLKVIADEMVDPEFGTGVVKITPAHDPNDFVTGKKHGLKIVKVINLWGRLTEVAGPYAGLKVKEAREKVVADLTQKGLIEKIDENYLHSVTVCYKCGHDLEPTIIPNWFIKVADLKSKVKQVVEKNKIRFFPAKGKKNILAWLEIMHDWPISRQIAWGIRIPVWYDITQNPDLNATFLDTNKKIVTGPIKDLLKNYSFSLIEKNLQNLSAPKESKYLVSVNKPNENCLQETDTFDTWFSSGQWPITTQASLPTDCMGTLSDILKFWVSRMIMFSLYLKNEIPFKDVYLWSMVADSKGAKMSKSKGNVVNPVDLIEKYGADALRFSLIYGIPAGSKVILSEDKVRGMRNFANKLWNIARFLTIIAEKNNLTKKDLTTPKPATDDDREFLQKLSTTITKVDESLNKYRFADAADAIYHFVWDDLASGYLEKTKDREDKKTVFSILVESYLTSLKLLHPFMPFVTETIWGELKDLRDNPEELLITATWPTIKTHQK